jgi:hypothetical protein
MVQYFAWQWMTAWMSSYAFRHARWSCFSVVGPFVPSRTLPSRSVTTRSSSVIVSYASDDGVSTTFPSGRRAEKLPAVPCTRLVRRLSCAVQSSSALISSAVPFGPFALMRLRPPVLERARGGVDAR